MRRLVLILLFAVSAGCSVETGSPDDADKISSISASVSTTQAQDTSTTEAPPESSAVIEIGPARYELSAICASGGAGEVEVSVAGNDVNGLPVIGYIRGFLGEPYVSLQVGTGVDAVLFEPRLEGILPFDLTATGVEFPTVDFVSELDLETGSFKPAGLGSAVVECLSYVRELPPVPFE